MTLTTRIISAMVLGLFVGVVLNLLTSSQLLGISFNLWAEHYVIDGLFDSVGQIFVRSLTLLVVPLVFVSLICGTTSLGGNTRMGMLAGKSIALYMVTTAVAITLALVMGVLIKPGEGIDLHTTAQFTANEAPAIKEVLINIFPSNPIQAMAEGKILQVIIFALLMGFAITKCGETGERVAAFFQDINAIIMKMVTILMNVAPYGVFCLLAKLFAGLGFGVIADLAKYFFTVTFVLFLHCIGVYLFFLKTLTGLSTRIFLLKVRSAMMFAFSTASSGATIPVTLRTAEERLGVDNKIASFTVPLGATINMDGTAIMQGVATAFIAQAYNIELGLDGYMLVVLTATLASIGTAAVPGVGLVMLVMVLNQVGLPVEGITLIIGVDRLLDMMRTAVNVTGDCMVSTIIGYHEGFLNKDIYNDPKAGIIKK